MKLKNDLYQRFVGTPFFDDRESVYVRWYPKSLKEVEGVEGFAPIIPDGIYIHVPFCDKICLFCPFNKRTTESELIEAYVSALLTEMELWAHNCEARLPIRFIYFGGGTPSVLSTEQINRILNQISINFPLDINVEISLECHPTHLNQTFFRDVKNIGVNRFSTGIQSFDQKLLNALGAQHSASDSIKAIEAARNLDVDLAIDLLYRCKGQTSALWQREIELAVSLGVNHISYYSLILGPNNDQPDRFVDAEMAVIADCIMTENGFRHYTSCASGGYDFAMPGRECRYSVDHWRAPQSQYFGFGPGAFGFIGNTTTVNRLGVRRYIDDLSEGRLPLVSCHTADSEELKRRYFVLGVKALSVNLEAYQQIYNCSAASLFRKEFDYLTDAGLATMDRSFLRLTDLGRHYVDTVSSVFFSEEERQVPHPEEPHIRAFERETM